jgi:hypothetical protein
VILEIPEVYGLMKEGRLTFSAVVQIAPVLGAQNKKALLPRVEGKSKKEIDAILAEFQPPQVIPDQTRQRLVKRQVSVECPGTDAPSESAGGHERTPELGEISLRCEGENNPTVKNSTPEIEVVLEKMYEIRFAADEELMELIRWMKAHLSHKFPKGASYLEIFKCAMKYYKDREDLATSKLTRSTKTKPKTDTRHIPKAVQREVWQRDNGRCAFIGPNGRRWNSQHNLQFDHYPVPFARGGPSTADNLRLLCAKHNRYTAEQLYGEQYTRKHCVKEDAALYIIESQTRPSVPTVAARAGYGHVVSLPSEPP